MKAGSLLEAKLAEARRVIRICARGEGFYASSLNYAYQYWLRDVSFSLPALIGLGYRERVKSHLTLFLEAFRRSGRIPAMIPRFGVASYLASFARMLWRPRLLAAYPLRFMLPNLARLGLQPWTGDSLPLLLKALYEYAQLTGDRSLLEAYSEQLESLREELVFKVEGGLLEGSSWMDAMANYVGKPTLTCQLLAYQALKLTGRGKEAWKLAKLIREAYWKGEHFTDLPEGWRLDSLGNLLAILYGLASREEGLLLVKALRKALTRWGVLNLYPPYPRRECSQKPYSYQNSAVWPFIQGLLVVALTKLRLQTEAEREFERMLGLRGFNEWYTLDGKPGGSPNQLWTAAHLLYAFQAVSGEI